MSKKWFEKTKQNFDKIAPLNHDELILNVAHGGVSIRQHRADHGELRITCGVDYGGLVGPNPILFFRGERAKAIEILELCANALRTLPPEPAPEPVSP